MAKDALLSGRIRRILSRRASVSERKMFGGPCFTINGNLCVGTWKGALILRLGRKNHQETLAEPHTKPAHVTSCSPPGVCARTWSPSGSGPFPCHQERLNCDLAAGPEPKKAGLQPTDQASTSK